MRFLRIFFKFLIIITLVSAATFFTVRELLLWWSGYSLGRQLTFLQRTNQWVEASNVCLEETGEEAKRLQLRFIDSRHYQLEVACANEQYVSLKDELELPPLIEKTTGWPGFSVSLPDKRVSGEVTLQLGGRARTIQAREDELITRNGRSEQSSSLLITSCEAHGLRCCDETYEVGQGQQMKNGVNDCNQSCFQSCQRRPNVLLFQTDPPLDVATRQLHLSKQNTFVLFNYAFEKTDRSLKQVTIDFGDGTSENLGLELIGSTTKEFQCDQAECRYQVSIKAIDESGISSGDLPLNRIQVVIN